MITRVLILCTGNICRSPIAAARLAGLRPDLSVASAGLGAATGRPVDPRMARAAAAMALPWPQDHHACQFTAGLGRGHDLILTMEAGQGDEVIRRAPDLNGRVFLLTHWTDRADIPDPYMRADADYALAVAAIETGVRRWSARIPVCLSRGNLPNAAPDRRDP